MAAATATAASVSTYLCLAVPDRTTRQGCYTNHPPGWIYIKAQLCMAESMGL